MSEEKQIAVLKSGIPPYDIGKVVGGFGFEVTPEESIPYTLARTYREHTTIYELMVEYSTFNYAMEFGCGYGRNLALLKSLAFKAAGIERDYLLAKIAQDLNPNVQVFHGIPWEWKPQHLAGEFDFLMTLTFLQHLDQQELLQCAEELNRISMPSGFLLIGEETDPSITDKTTTGRTVAEYQDLFKSFELVKTVPRKVEATFPKPDSGTFMLFMKKD